MAWLAVDADGQELIAVELPDRNRPTGIGISHYWGRGKFDIVNLPPGSIQKLTGKTITWNDEPIGIGEHEAKEPEYVPFDLESIKEHLGKVLLKTDLDYTGVLIAAARKNVIVGNDIVDYIVLNEDFTFLDGTPCGKLK